MHSRPPTLDQGISTARKGGKSAKAGIPACSAFRSPFSPSNNPFYRDASVARGCVGKVRKEPSQESRSTPPAPSRDKVDSRVHSRVVCASGDPMGEGVEPLFAGQVRLIRWANNHASGMTATLSIVDEELFTVHPLKGLRAATDSDRMNGQRLYVALSSNGAPLYRGDAILLWWSDDCRHGMKFTFRLREGPDGAGDVHPCTGMSAGTRNGELLQVALWAIADDEVPEDPRATRKRKAFADLNPTQQAQILCRDSRFHQWLSRRLDLVDNPDRRVQLLDLFTVDPQAFAVECVRELCGISSRAQLSREPDALTRWKRLLVRYDEDRRGYRG